jgi:hypothetical protein
MLSDVIRFLEGGDSSRPRSLESSGAKKTALAKSTFTNAVEFLRHRK